MYNEFLKNEREFSIRFLESQQILTDRFDEREYLVLKELFKMLIINILWFFQGEIIIPKFIF